MNGPRLREAAPSVTHLTALCPPPVMPSPLQCSSASRRTAGAAFVGGDDVTVSAPASLRTRSRGRRFTREGPSQNLVLRLMALIMQVRGRIMQVRGRNILICWHYSTCRSPGTLSIARQIARRRLSYPSQRLRRL